MYHSHSWCHCVEEFDPVIHGVRDQTCFYTKPPVTNIMRIILKQTLVKFGTSTGIALGHTILSRKCSVTLSYSHNTSKRGSLCFTEGQADKPKDMKGFAIHKCFFQHPNALLPQSKTRHRKTLYLFKYPQKLNQFKYMSAI